MHHVSCSADRTSVFIRDDMSNESKEVADKNDSHSHSHSDSLGTDSSGIENRLNLKRVTRMNSTAVISKKSKVEWELSQKSLVSWKARFF